MDAQGIASERQRAVALLAPERTGVPLEAVTVNPPTEALGALTGMSWDTDAPAVRDWQQAHSVGDALVEMLDGEVYHARALTNGALLLLVIARIDDPDAARRRARVDRLLSAFSGLE
jgi:hypothetical protein